MTPRRNHRTITKIRERVLEELKWGRRTAMWLWTHLHPRPVTRHHLQLALDGLVKQRKVLLSLEGDYVLIPTSVGTEQGFNVGDAVQWTMKHVKGNSLRQGVIDEVVPARAVPKNPKFKRAHQITLRNDGKNTHIATDRSLRESVSYVVYVPLFEKFYWPKAELLHPQAANDEPLPPLAIDAVLLGMRRAA